MVSAWINTNVTEHFHHGKQLDDAVKEIIANAIDADNRPGIAPILSASSTMVEEIGSSRRIITLKIQDNGTGRGIIPDDFCIGRQIEDHSTTIGQHGIGLKESIAIFTRDKLTVAIESKGCRFQFSLQSAGPGLRPTLHYQYDSVPINTTFSTNVTISGWQSMEQLKEVVTSVKSRFLVFQKLGLPKHEANDIEMYMRTPTDEATTRHINYFYVHGAKVETHSNLKRIYNFTKVTAEERKAIGTNHTVLKKDFFRRIRAFNKLYFPHLMGHRETCEFFEHQPPPVVPVGKRSFDEAIGEGSSSLEATAITITDRNFESQLVEVICHQLRTVEQSTMFTLSTAERHHTTTIADTLESMIKQIPGLNVAEVKRTGSIKKTTAVSGYGDEDLIVIITDFNLEKVSSGEYKQTMMEGLSKEGIEFFACETDIFHCIFKGIEWSIAITAQDETFLNANARYKNFLDPNYGASVVPREIQSDCNYLCEVIRAAKYWVSRHPLEIDNKRLTSFVTELILLEVHQQRIQKQGSTSKKDLKAALFLDFLKYLEYPPLILWFGENNQTRILDKNRDVFKNYAEFATKVWENCTLIYDRDSLLTCIIFPAVK